MHLVQTCQFGYRQCCIYIDICCRLSSLAIVLVCIQAFGIDFPVCLQAILFLYRHLAQTFQFGYSSSLYTCFWYRLSSLVIGNVAFIQTFAADFLVWMQFQFVYRLLVQTFQFGNRPCFYYKEIWYRLSISAIVLICILAFGIDFPVCLQAMMFLYRHLVQTFQFGYSSSLYTGFWNRLSFQFGYWLCCFYIDISYRLSSSSIVLVCILAFVIGFPVRLQVVGIIQTFGTDFAVRLQFQFVYWLLPQTFYPVWLQAMLFLYRHLVETFQFGYSSSLYTSIWYRLSFQFCYR